MSATSAKVHPDAPEPRSLPTGGHGLGERLALRAAALVVLAVGWEMFARFVGGLLVPTFGDVVTGTVGLVTDGDVWRAFLVSNQALAIGFFVTVVTGVPLGFLMGRSKIAAGIFEPYNRILLVAPLAGFIPVLVITVGLNTYSRVIIIWSFAVVMLVVNCQAGVRQVSRSLVDMASVFGASELQLWRRVLLPGAMPAVMVGLRIALSRAFTGMVIVELLMVPAGVGGLILEYQSFFMAGEIYGVVLLVVLEAILLIWLVDRLHDRLVPHQAGSADRAVA